MAGTTILPTKDIERITWSLNFETEFTAVAGTLGFSGQEVTDLLNDAAAMRHAIMFAQAGAVFSKASTAFKNGMLGGVGENQLTPNQPGFNVPSNPPSQVDAGIIERLSNAMTTAKLSLGYTPTIGETLMIATTQVASLNMDDAKPTGTTTSLTGSIVRIDWKKGKFDGIYIDSQRNDETDWTRLDFDMRSPYEDIRPPSQPGKPEERRYRLRYFMDNTAVGQNSDVITAITQP